MAQMFDNGVFSRDMAFDHDLSAWNVSAVTRRNLFAAGATQLQQSHYPPFLVEDEGDVEEDDY